MNNDAWLLLGALIGAGIPLSIYALWSAVAFRLYPGETLLVLRFGRLARTVSQPGLAYVVDNGWPWVRTIRVSRRLQALLLRDVEVHDQGGTQLGVDLFVEYRITDPARATFGIEDLPRALENVVSHAVITVLGAKTLPEILGDQGEFGEEIRRETRDETGAWGVEVCRVLLRQVRPSSAAIEQLLGEIRARLERVKARVEEEGRQEVSLLHARTSFEVAARIAEARGQYPLEIGAAYAELRKDPQVYAAYQTLHDLVLLRPERTIAFVGFEPGEIRAAEAAFLAPPRAAGE